MLGGTIDQTLTDLVTLELPALGVAEHDRHDDLWLVGRRVADEPRVLRVRRALQRERAGLAGGADLVVLAERPGRAAEVARRLHHPADLARDLAVEHVLRPGRDAVDDVG